MEDEEIVELNAQDNRDENQKFADELETRTTMESILTLWLPRKDKYLKSMTDSLSILARESEIRGGKKNANS